MFMTSTCLLVTFTAVCLYGVLTQARERSLHRTIILFNNMHQSSSVLYSVGSF